MFWWLSLSRRIDALNDWVGRTVSWALLLMVLICAGNAIVRYAFHVSSNAWLEIQWYLFALIFLLAAGHTLERNEHVRIDVLAARLSKRSQVWIDVFGLLFFLLPISLLILYYSIPYALDAIESGEMSSNAGGLILWPAKILIPIGFFLLILQAISELIKRFAYLRGELDASAFEKHGSTPEEEVEAIRHANQLPKAGEQ